MRKSFVGTYVLIFLSYAPRNENVGKYIGKLVHAYGKCMLNFSNFLKNLFIFGCVGSLLLHAGFSLVAASGGYSVVVHRLLIAVTSLVAEQGL